MPAVVAASVVQRVAARKTAVVVLLVAVVRTTAVDKKQEGLVVLMEQQQGNHLVEVVVLGKSAAVDTKNLEVVPVDVEEEVVQNLSVATILIHLHASVAYVKELLQHVFHQSHVSHIIFHRHFHVQVNSVKASMNQ